MYLQHNKYVIDDKEYERLGLPNPKDGEVSKK